MIDKTSDTKLVWTSPAVTVYGDVEEITLQAKLKVLGSVDDFGISGISDAP